MKKLITGNEAVARGAFEAGAEVVCAYPGTPSTEITETIMKEYPEIYSEWSVNEKVAYETAYGSAIAGKRSMACMKQVGLNVAADPFFTSSYTGVNAGFVIVSADEPGIFSSQNEQDNRNYAKAAKIPMLEPSNAQEAKVFVKKAFEISEKFDTPVMLRLTTRICHTHSPVNFENREEAGKKEYVKDEKKRAMIPVYALDRHKFVEERLEKLSEFAETFEYNEEYFSDKKSDFGIISSGVAFEHCAEATEEKVPILKLAMTYPLPKNKIKDFANKFSKVYVIEENDDFLYDEIKKIDGINSKILKKDDEYKVNELTVDRVKEIIFNRNTVGEKIDNLPPRPPQFCPGCPHRATFYLLNRYRKTVSGDIGCYGLGVLPPFKAMDTILCMGASVTMGHGFNVAGENSVSVIGDSTFFHTGINGLINTFYNKGKGLIIILDNSITAMTGGQINPSSRTKNTVYVDIEKIVKSIGIEYVKTIDSYDMKTIEREIRDAKEIDELRVLIVKNPCAMMLKEPIGKIQRINQNKCVKCKMCLKVGCPAITFKDNVMEINPQLCIGCTVCTQVCPKGAIEDDERY